MNIQERNYLLYTTLVVFLGATSLVVTTAKIASEWGATNRLVWQKAVELKIQKPYRIEKVKPKEVLSPLAKEILKPVEDLQPVEKKIVEKWGIQYGYIALAVFRCESGLRAEAVNWETKDIGIAQINFPTWKEQIAKKFGYSLRDLLDEDKNLEVAYWIWDRADGKEGDGKGKFDDWVAFSNGSFAGCVK